MLTGKKVKRVAIIGANRIPFSRSNTTYAKASNKDMMTEVLNGLVKKYKLEGKRLGEVAGGAVIKQSNDFNLIRESVLGTQLAPETPACDLQQACDTGLEAAIYIANKIALGQIEVGIAGGVDTTSDAPIGIGEGLRKILLEANRQKEIKDKALAFLKLRPKDLVPNPPRNEEPRTGLSMGAHTQITADTFSVKREDQDQLAYESHIKLAKAYEEGFYDDLVSPYLGLERDNNLRANTTIEKLSSLKGVFGGSGTMTAGNSTPLTDGASCILLASEEWAKENGYEIMAYLKTAELAGIEFVEQKENLLLAPVYAMSRMLEKEGLELQDFDYYEIHEAFASQVLATLKIWEDEAYCKQYLNRDKAMGSIDRSKLNVKGGSLGTGHPFAATGGRILGVLAKLLQEKGSGRGLISICAAGGMGLTAILER